MFDATQTQALLAEVAAGRVAPEQALDQLRRLDTEAVGDFARLDHHRALRTGFPEAIWGQDKSIDQLRQILEQLAAAHRSALVTRLRPEQFRQLRGCVPELRYYEAARILALRPDESPRQPGRLAILAAGTSDLPVAEEAAVTARLSGFTVDCLWDLGVAGLHRLLSQRDRLDRADAIIAVAGMEGALPTVVAGLTRVPVIAVPTSVGYGASFGGLSALLTMLNSCATGIGVVNIDNGYGAAMLAARILTGRAQP